MDLTPFQTILLPNYLFIYPLQKFSSVFFVLFGRVPRDECFDYWGLDWFCLWLDFYTWRSGNINFGEIWFQGHHGRAFLFLRAMNVRTGEPEDLRLATGVFTVADVFCNHCNEYLGWKYLHAYEPSQRYKEGRHVLEMYKITKDSS